jgi:hypothetical protein
MKVASHALSRTIQLNPKRAKDLASHKSPWFDPDSDQREREMMRVFVALLVALCILCSLLAQASQDIFICESDDPKLLGKYRYTLVY